MDNSTSILDLPQPLVQDVLCRDVHTSTASFFNIKAVCKEFYEIAEDDDDILYCNVCFDNLDQKRWGYLNHHFLEKCIAHKNLGALCIRGIDHFFTRAILGPSVSNLEEAIDGGSMLAKYALAAVLIYSGVDVLEQHGVRLMGELKQSTSAQAFLGFHNRLKELVDPWWMHNVILYHIHATGRRLRCCNLEGHPLYMKGTNWCDKYDLDKLHDNPLCQDCVADMEVQYMSDCL